MIEPNINDLKKCIQLLASLMKFTSLPETQAKQLIDHVLFKNEYDSVAGKEGLECFLKNLITEGELRNLFIAHSATKIA